MGYKSPVGKPCSCCNVRSINTSRKQGRSREGSSGGSWSTKLWADEQKWQTRQEFPGKSAQHDTCCQPWSGDLYRCEPKGSMATGQDQGRPDGYELAMASGPRSLVCQRSMGTDALPGYGSVALGTAWWGPACQVVWGGREQDPPLPDYRIIFFGPFAHLDYKINRLI